MLATMEQAPIGSFSVIGSKVARRRKLVSQGPSARSNKTPNAATSLLKEHSTAKAKQSAVAKSPLLMGSTISSLTAAALAPSAALGKSTRIDVTPDPTLHIPVVRPEQLKRGDPIYYMWVLEVLH
jgi:hypothetical protein